MTKILRIECCDDCKYMDDKYNRDGFKGTFCNHPEMDYPQIVDWETLLPDCPLEDEPKQCAAFTKSGKCRVWMTHYERAQEDYDDRQNSAD